MIEKKINIVRFFIVNDLNEDNMIDFNEFKELITKIDKNLTNKEVLYLFNYFDQD